MDERVEKLSHTDDIDPGYQTEKIKESEPKLQDDI